MGVCLLVFAFLMAQGKKLVVSLMVQDLIDLKHLPQLNRSIGGVRGMILGS